MSLSNLKACDVGGVQLDLPYLRAYKASASLAGSSNGALAFDSVSGGLAGEFVIGTGYFTPLVSGIYQISGRYDFNAGGGSAGFCFVRFARAGGTSVIADNAVNFSAGNNGVMTSGLGYLVAGTYYYLTSYQTVGAPLAITDLELIISLVSKA
jgi:hypothetical protein